MLKSGISTNLKDLRKSKNLTQSQLAKILQIGQATIAGYESGTREPCISNLTAYANFFECSIDFLIGREDDFGNILFPPSLQNNIYPAFTDKEKTLGLNPNHPVVLSDDDRYRIHLLAEAEEKLGKAYVDGVLKMIELSIQQKD